MHQLKVLQRIRGFFCQSSVIWRHSNRDKLNQNTIAHPKTLLLQMLTWGVQRIRAGPGVHDTTISVSVYRTAGTETARENGHNDADEDDRTEHPAYDHTNTV